MTGQRKNLPPAMRDATPEVTPRTDNLFRNHYDNSQNETWALGGALEFKSGYLWGAWRRSCAVAAAILP
jgi:hypothetical protein